MDSNIASASFLEHLKSLFASTASSTSEVGVSLDSRCIIANPWYIVAAAAFASCNRPEGIPAVFLYALQDLRHVQERLRTDEETAHKERLRMARRMREGLLKASMLCGAPRAINGLTALHQVMPEDLREKSTLRNTSTSTEEFYLAGEKIFQSMYGRTADAVQNALDEIYPDFGWLTKLVGYGIVYGQTDILTQVETSFVLVAGVIGMETPRQFGWHLANTRHGGASLQEARAVRQICIEVAERAGLKWKKPVPDVE